MKTIVLQLKIFSFIIFINLFVSAQPNADTNLSSIDSSSDKYFVSENGNFSIMLPESTDLKWSFKEGEITLKYFDLGYYVDAFNENDFASMVKRFNYDTVVEFNAKELEKISKFDSKSKIATTYFDLESGNYAIEKYNLHHKRLYVILAVVFDKKNSEKFESVLNSFKVTKTTDSDSILKKIFDNITPEPLPQNPVAVNEKNDLYDENLKGNIKQINLYVKDLHYPVSERNYLQNIQEFDKRGYLIKETDPGLSVFNVPYSVEVFGFIDGKRVSNFKYQLFYLSIFPPKKENISTTPPDPYFFPVYDKRYTTAYEKRYKNGKLSEKIWYDSSGRIKYRRTFEYDKDQLTLLGYDYYGNLNMKRIQTLNKYGDCISQIEYHQHNTLPSTEQFSYEYDEKGNWIKKIHSLKVGGRFVPQIATYRIITYY